MPVYPGFTGGSVPARSRTVNVERTVNLYPEHTGGTPKRDPVLYNRPSCVPWTYCANGPIRCLFWQDGRFFAVSGGYFYECFKSRNVIIRGLVRVDAHPATISSNGTGGNQLFITSGGLGYIYDLTTDTLAQITDPEFPNPVTFGAYVDGYFLAMQGDSNRVQFSSILDGDEWNGLDVFQTSLSSDLKSAMLVSNRRIFLWGTKNTEVWYNAADGNTVFLPDPSAGVISHGIAAPYTAIELDNTPYWLGQDAAGSGLVWRFNGYTPEPISNPQVDGVIQSWPSLTNCLAFGFQMVGHAWYALYSPYAETTWMYDVTMRTWTEWALEDHVWMRFFPWIGRCQAAGWNQQFIGARNNGTIYRMDMTVYQDRIVTLGGLEP